MTIYSPFNIEVLLHYHVSPAPHPRIDVEAVQEITAKFVGAGVIERCEEERSYRTTPLGKAWVQAICNVPIPRLAYVDENGKVIQ